MHAQTKPLVVLRPVPEGWRVSVEPPLPDGEDRTRTYADKVGAWTYAQGLWTDHRLGFRDESLGNVATTKPPRGPYGKRAFF
jgi:hypothetical protein